MHESKQDEEFRSPLPEVSCKPLPALPEISGGTPLPPHQQLLTVAQTCHALRICRRTLHKWTEEDRILPSVKIGHAKRYVLADVLALIEEFKRRSVEKSLSRISAFERVMKARLAKEISQAA